MKNKIIFLGGTYTTATKANTTEALAGTDDAKYITPLTANARALQGDLTRQVRDALFSDGATSNRRLEATPGAAGAIAGLPATFWVKRFFVPTQPSVTATICALSPASATPPNQYGNSLSIEILASTDYLRIRQNGATSSDYRYFQNTTFRSDYSGRWVQIVVSFPSGDSTTNPTIWIDGVDKSASFSLGINNPPNWMPTALATTKFLVGYNWPAGDVPEVEYGPGAWTAAEALAAAQTGLAPTWWRGGTGSAVALYTSDFSADTNSWIQFDVTAAGNIDGIGGQDNCLRATLVGGSSGLHQVSRTLTTTDNLRYRYSVDVYIPSTNANPFGVVLIANGGLAVLATTATKDAWVTLSGEFTESSDNRIRVRANGTIDSDGDVFYVRNVRVWTLGPLAKWEIQPIATCYDAGSNKIPLLLTSGITPITNKRDWVLQGQTNTNGNQQLLGASVFVSPYDYTRMMLDSIEVNGTSTATVGVGSASGGAQYVTAAAIASGRNRRTLVTPIAASADIWVSSNATDTLQHTIRGHIID